MENKGTFRLHLGFHFREYPET